MARRIEAWTIRNTAEAPIPDIRSTSRSQDDRATTVVIHDGDKHERVFTEGEVRAMLRDLIEDQARCDVHNGWQSGMIPDFTGIASKHGVSLDSA